VTIRISRKKGDEQDEREAEKFLHHWVGNAAYRIQILAVNWANYLSAVSSNRYSIPRPVPAVQNVQDV
jgi:hypothetical protein